MPDPIVVRAQIAQLVSTLGATAAARKLGLNRNTVMALAAGANVRAGTMAIAAQRLGLLAPPAVLAITSAPTASDIG